MLVAVTGGTGFLGAHSVRSLLDAGHRVRLLVHPDEQPERTLGALGVGGDRYEAVAGDVRDPDAVRRLLGDADAVLHMAGIVGVDDRREALMWEVNVAATAHVLGEAALRGLDPIVHVASYAALFPAPGPVIDHDTPTAVGRTAYGRTKAAADLFARGLQDAGAPVVITYPSSVVGPPAGDRAGISADGFAPLLRFGVSVGFDGAMAMIDVRDVADVHAAVMVAGQGPRRLVCGGELVPFDEAVDALGVGAGRAIRRVRLWPGAVRAMGRISDVVAARTPFPPSFSSEAARLLLAGTPTDDSAALAVLGRPWRPVREALHAAAAAATAGRP